MFNCVAEPSLTKQYGAEGLKNCEIIRKEFVGLKNINNSCYINAIIQCLRACDQINSVRVRQNEKNEWLKFLLSLFVKK